MANKTILDLDPAASVAGTESVELSTGERATLQQIADLGGGGSGESVNALSIASGVLNIDCALGNYFTLVLNANVTSVTFSNLPGAGVAQTIMIKLVQDGTGNHAMTFPSSFDWASGTVPVLSTAANAKDILAVTTFDQGTTWEATLSKAHA